MTNSTLESTVTLLRSGPDVGEDLIASVTRDLFSNWHYLTRFVSAER
jgi:hypothetical protein